LGGRNTLKKTCALIVADDDNDPLTLFAMMSTGSNDVSVTVARSWLFAELWSII
jgi:hypothetical protein